MRACVRRTCCGCGLSTFTLVVHLQLIQLEDVLGLARVRCRASESCCSQCSLYATYLPVRCSRPANADLPHFVFSPHRGGLASGCRGVACLPILNLSQVSVWACSDWRLRLWINSLSCLSEQDFIGRDINQI